MKEDYFIRINKVSDNLGNIWMNHYNCENPLRVGDNYEIIVEAVDPKNRDIEYEISTIDLDFKIIQNENHFNFLITENLISNVKMFIITARTPKSEYKNQANFQTTYIILPKLEIL